MILDVFYISSIIFALFAIQTDNLRNAIIYLSVFSLISSIIYLLLGAPDVAIAEAIIGCTLSTVLYLVALKKYKIYTVYYSCISKNEASLMQIQKEKEKVIDLLKIFAKNKELQLDIINTSSKFKQLLKTESFDAIIYHNENGISISGDKNSYQYNELTSLLKTNLHIKINANYIEDKIINLINLEK